MAAHLNYNTGVSDVLFEIVLCTLPNPKGGKKPIKWPPFPLSRKGAHHKAEQCFLKVRA